jgi:hypothetical protein
MIPRSAGGSDSWKGLRFAARSGAAVQVDGMRVESRPLSNVRIAPLADIAAYVSFRPHAERYIARDWFQ